MPTVQISCPFCSQALVGPFAAGSRVQCPRCRASFTVRPVDLRAASVASTAPPPAPVQDRPRAPQPSRASWDESPPPAATPRWVLPAAIVAVAVLLIVGAGVVLALHFAAPSPHVAAGDPPPDHRVPVRDDKPKNTNPPPNPDPTPPLVLPPPPPETHPDPPPPQPTGLSKEQDAKVKKAIERGIAYLETTQQEEGSWDYPGNPVGATSLPGLTLLNGGVPANDAHIQKAAEFVRDNTQSLAQTYELALTILFLDRLNDPQDEKLIQTLALRLIAGQSQAGGWTYACPVLLPKDQRNLLIALRKTRPGSALELIASRPEDAPPAPKPDADGAKAIQALPAEMQTLPALQAVPADADFPATDGVGGDNSCTQFAILGLWTARRHDVPMERALAWVNKRFRVSQAEAGGWDYTYVNPSNGAHTPSMTGAGLLGLAVGHGVTADLQGDDPAKLRGDAAIDKGMAALSENIGAALGDKKGDTVLPQEDLYFMWSVERVGVLYNRRTIAEKEWYPWGAEILLDNQLEDGSWTNGVYPGAAPPLDTSFALLFLKRANLASDLSTKLQFLSPIKK